MIIRQFLCKKKCAHFWDLFLMGLLITTTDTCVSLIWRVFDRDVNDVNTANYWLMKRTLTLIYRHKSLHEISSWTRVDGGHCNIFISVNEIQLLQCRNKWNIHYHKAKKSKWSKRVRAYNTSHSFGLCGGWRVFLCDFNVQLKQRNNRQAFHTAGTNTRILRKVMTWKVSPMIIILNMWGSKVLNKQKQPSYDGKNAKPFHKYVFCRVS